MTPTERRAVDAACLRILGWTQKHWSHAAGTWSGVPPGETRRRDCSPSTDPALVVPLAEALRGQLEQRYPRRWSIEMRFLGWDPGWIVEVEFGDDGRVIETSKRLEAALALAAAQAVLAAPKDA